MVPFDSYEYVWPLFAGQMQDINVPAPTTIAGSAFCIGGDIFLTAGHSVRGVIQAGVGTLGRRQGQQFFNCDVSRYEIADDLDIAVLQVRLNAPAACLHWTPNQLLMAEDVRVWGYAHGLDPARRMVSIRVFQGHVVCRTRFDRLPGEPWAYELSFACPTGLSGAPLCVRGGRGESVVAGLVLGNSKSEMLVLAERERTDDGRTEQIFERYHTLQLGIALAADVILERTFKLILGGKSIRQHLTEHGLMGA